MKIIPAIDIIGGKTVRLNQGKYDNKISYDISPMEAAEKWQRIGARLIHIIDLDGAKEGRPVNVKLIERISKNINIPVQSGGGYRKIADIHEALNKGIYRVVLGSRALQDMDFTRECIDAFNDRVIFSIDTIDGKIGLEGWVKTADKDIFNEIIPFLKDNGVKEIIHTDIRKDGTLSGPDIEGLKIFIKKAEINIITAGGIKNMGHIEALKKLEPKKSPYGISGAIIGRALYDGTIDLKEALNAC